jgi:phosphate transport system ATP-binding protein
VVSPPHVAIRDLTVRFGRVTALDRITLDIPRHHVFGIIGPAGSGKSTLLQCLNRFIDLAPDVGVEGEVTIDGRSIFAERDVTLLRRRVGMVLPLPVGLPLSVYDNVAFAPRLGGLATRAALDDTVETCLRQAALWDEVKDRLGASATTLSGGQQQRLTIARALSHAPEILCLDEFSIAVDPVTTMKIEAALTGLKTHMTIVVATNLVQQAQRLCDQVAFLNASRLVEVGPVSTIFSDGAAQAATRDYVGGRIG